MRKPSVLVYLLALAVSACTANTGPLDDSPEQNQSAILNGTVVTPWPSATPAYTRAIMDLHGCTGTLVDPEWVLTAKHCSPVPEVWNHRPSGDVTRIVDRRQDHASLDVSMLHLSFPYTDVPLVPIYWGTTATVSNNQTVKCYGYGASQTGNTCGTGFPPCQLPSGMLGEDCEILDSGSGIGICLYTDGQLRTTTLQTSRDSNPLYFDLQAQNGETLLPGDSGGPCFYQDQLVSHFVNYFFDIQNGAFVFVGSSESSLAEYRDWMVSTMHGVSNLTYTQCATDYGTCVIGTSPLGRYFAYGVNNSFVYKYISSSPVGCNPTTFGSDPAPGVVKACYYANYGYAATENTTGYAANSEIAYGANGQFNFAHESGNFSCSNATFGDPAPGVVKACYIGLPGYTFIAGEGAGFNLGSNNPYPMAYGANGRFLYALKTGSGTCNNTTFGGDPAPGVGKTCYRQIGVYVASEGQSFNQSNFAHCMVYYTSGRNGNALTKSILSGTCNNTTFGGDPDYGYTKMCYADCGG